MIKTDFQMEIYVMY